MIQMLNILEGFPLPQLEANQAKVFHLLIESMRFAYADRSKFLGDPDFVDIPISGLLSKAYAESLRTRINPNYANSSAEIAPGEPLSWEESPETTHFSVMDRFGNAVSNTTTLNFSYGNAYMVPGTGMLLNNEMDDFSAKPGVPNAYGLLGGEANAVEPGKRMLSSMTPTIVLKDGKPFLVTGSPGGSRIITAVLHVISNVIDHQKNIAVATTLPRIHHQWFPDDVRLETGISPDSRHRLVEMGHTISSNTSPMGSVNSILFDGLRFYGFSDPRREGLAIGF